jgi:PD-(D/E)XK endonuclease
MAATHYIGKAGQCAVMAELALRGYNVSIPEIDVGDDIFVLNDSSGRLFRIQVKTATGKKLARNDRAYRCQFSLKRSHVKNSRKTGSHYVLVARCGGAWRYLVFKTYILDRLIEKGLGVSMSGDRHMITAVFFERYKALTSTRANAMDLSNYAGAWKKNWPKLAGGISN